MSELTTALTTAAQVLDDQADEFTRLDALQGDGDLGRTARLIAAAVRRAAAEHPGTAEQPGAAAEVLRASGTLIASSAPSSSGTLIASAFLAAAKVVAEPGSDTLIDGLVAAVAGIQHRGKAQPGDRTMLDALTPAVESLRSAPGDLAAAAEAVEHGVEATRTMTAKFGRARFLAANAVGEPDPGAAMVGAALAAALRSA